MRFVLVISILCLTGSISADFENDYLTLHMKYGDQANKNAERSSVLTKVASFNCNISPLTNKKPTSVHALRPSDIEVIGAIGDSLTAANGAKAKTIIGLLAQDRGVSWSMGGEKADITKSITLPNILRKFNPELYGFSTGKGKAGTINAVFNWANPGDTSHEMYGQVVKLVKSIKESKRVDFEKSWKLVTFFVGGNDLCKASKDVKKYTVQKFVDNLRKTLDYLRDNSPRTFVNMVTTLDVRGIESLNNTICRNMQSILCPSYFDSSFKAKLDEYTKGYQRGTEDLINSGRYDIKDDFTVVLQPFMTDMKPPILPNGKPDYSLFAPDCFHFSTKGHQAAAAELWNAMLTPVGQKHTKWSSHIDEPLFCPTNEKPYLFTSKNS